MSAGVPPADPLPVEEIGAEEAHEPEAVAPDGRAEPAAVEDEPVEQAVEAYPVLAQVTAVERTRMIDKPAVQAAALAATGFVAGAATVALLRRHGARRLARVRFEQAALRELRDGELAKRSRAAGRRARRSGDEGDTVVASTYLVNVRLLEPTQD
jgi:hypothetical protein